MCESSPLTHSFTIIVSKTAFCCPDYRIEDINLKAGHCLRQIHSFLVELQVGNREMSIGTKVEEFTKETSFHGVKYVFNGHAQKVRRWGTTIFLNVFQKNSPGQLFGSTFQGRFSSLNQRGKHPNDSCVFATTWQVSLALDYVCFRSCVLCFKAEDFKRQNDTFPDFSYNFLFEHSDTIKILSWTAPLYIRMYRRVSAQAAQQSFASKRTMCTSTNVGANSELHACRRWSRTSPQPTAAIAKLFRSQSQKGNFGCGTLLPHTQQKPSSLLRHHIEFIMKLQTISIIFFLPQKRACEIHHVHFTVHDQIKAARVKRIRPQQPLWPSFYFVYCEMARQTIMT